MQNTVLIFRDLTRAERTVLGSGLSEFLGAKDLGWRWEGSTFFLHGPPTQEALAERLSPGWGPRYAEAIREFAKTDGSLDMMTTLWKLLGVDEDTFRSAEAKLVEARTR